MLNLLKSSWLTAITGILLHAIQDERTLLTAFRPNMRLAIGFSSACPSAQGSIHADPSIHPDSRWDRGKGCRYACVCVCVCVFIA